MIFNVYSTLYTFVYFYMNIVFDVKISSKYSTLYIQHLWIYIFDISILYIHIFSSFSFGKYAWNIKHLLPPLQLFNRSVYFQLAYNAVCLFVVLQNKKNSCRLIFIVLRFIILWFLMLSRKEYKTIFFEWWKKIAEW